MIVSSPCHSSRIAKPASAESSRLHMDAICFALSERNGKCSSPSGDIMSLTLKDDLGLDGQMHSLLRRMQRCQERLNSIKNW